MGWKKNLTVITALVGSATVGMHLINKWIQFSATLDGLLKTESEMYYEWRFGKVYYAKQGEGQPVLLIHDLTTGSSAYEWNKIVKSLSKNHTVYTLDLLGCGRSDKPNLTYTNFLYVQLITDFIKHVIGDSTDIIVTGSSSSIVLGVCNADKNVVKRVVMINPEDINGASKIPGNRSRILSNLIQVPIIGTLLYHMLNRKEEVRETFLRKYYYDSSGVEESDVSTYYETAHSGGASSKYLFASIVGRYLTANIPLYMNNLDNSIFALFGEQEPGIERIEEQYKSCLPSIEVFKIENTKHLPQLEQPLELLEQIGILLNEE